MKRKGEEEGLKRMSEDEGERLKKDVDGFGGKKEGRGCSDEVSGPCPAAWLALPKIITQKLYSFKHCLAY